MSIEIETYDLPEHWASALINGDESGLDDDDAAALDRWEHATRGADSFFCVDVADSDSGDFRRYHDAERFGVLACNVAQFTFHRIKES